VILDRTLDQAGGKGLFTKELEAALLRGEADLLVHSLKDVPMAVDPRIPLVGVSAREDERDVLVLPEGGGAARRGESPSAARACAGACSCRGSFRAARSRPCAATC
jgi:porphobilinogen deaminase